jgi:AraC-like DNA-binding protein
MVPARTPLPPDVYLRLARARRLLDAGDLQAPRLDALVRAAGFSRFHFIRLFRRAFEVTPYQ